MKQINTATIQNLAARMKAEREHFATLDETRKDAYERIQADIVTTFYQSSPVLQAAREANALTETLPIGEAVHVFDRTDDIAVSVGYSPAAGTPAKLDYDPQSVAVPMFAAFYKRSIRSDAANASESVDIDRDGIMQASANIAKEMDNGFLNGYAKADFNIGSVLHSGLGGSAAENTLAQAAKANPSATELKNMIWSASQKTNAARLGNLQDVVNGVYEAGYTNIYCFAGKNVWQFLNQLDSTRTGAVVYYRDVVGGMAGVMSVRYAQQLQADTFIAADLSTMSCDVAMAGSPGFILSAGNDPLNPIGAVYSVAAMRVRLPRNTALPVAKVKTK